MKTFTWMALAVMAGLTAVPAIAQMDHTDWTRHRGSDERWQSQSTSSISGKITGVHNNEKVRGDDRRHTLIDVKTDDNRRVTLDLGRQDDLRQQDIRPREDQQISAQGYFAQVDGKNGFVVERGTVNARTFTTTNLSQSGRYGYSDDRYSSDRRYNSDRFIEGRVTDLKNFTLSGERNDHRLAKIRTDEGRTLVVDLGTTDQVRDLRIREGQRVAVRGPVGEINGRPVIFAQQILHASDTNRRD